jgi:hypothetical protein
VKRPEPVWVETGLGTPEIVTGEVDVLPAERCDMGEQGIWHGLAAVAQGIQRATEIEGVALVVR